MTPTAALLHPAIARTSHRLPEQAVGEDTLDTAFQLGWDHACYGVTPPLEILCSHARLQQGFRSGRATFGRRTLAAGAEVRGWLELRLHALHHRLAFETVQLTPHFLGQLDVAHCPVTRERLTRGLAMPSDRCITRLRRDAGFAAGHLVVLSTRARQARGHLGLPGLLQRQRSCENGPQQVIDGLDARQWARWVTLCSFSQVLPHADAARLPLYVLPPNRLRLFNPVQALQALLSRALLHRTPSRRLAALRDRVPSPALRAFDAWLLRYRTQVAELLPQQPSVAPHWALEDAWQEPGVQRAWQRFASRLEAPQCERIVIEGGEGRTRWLPEAAATEGWALEQGGRRPVRSPRPAGRGREPQRQFALFDHAA